MMANWNQYYSTPLTLDGIIRNLYGQKDFLSAIYDSNAKTLLEVGVGSGAMSIFFSWVGLAVTGIDADAQVVQKVQAESARLNGRAKFEVADTFQLPYPDQSFDLIFHQGLLEHFSDEEIHRMLKEQLRVARRVAFSVPNRWYPRRDFGNERLMSRAQWENILHPYRVVKSGYYSLKFFPKWYLPRVPIQYMAIIEQPNGS
jgi:2-polyprenyl-3-methyl-5-hydroxy-6-metoxy-1,4-benzoquinol methylase